MGLLIMTAPPGWGKTQKILEWHRANECSIVFISPLRALTDEFEKRCSGLDRVLRPQSHDDWKSYLQSSKKRLLIVTAEQLTDQRLHLLQNKNILYIIDEIHLFYFWGESFRNRLLEIWMFLAATDQSVVAMTATLEKNLYNRLLADSLNNFSEVSLFDKGRNQFHTSPFKTYDYPIQKWINAEIKNQLYKKRSQPILVFVAFRESVEMWLAWAQRNSIRAIGCVGGEAKMFSQKMGANQWQLIVATSVLSHGVNLPSVSDVFITYHIQDREFWYQMAGRGGRRGEKFNLHHLKNVTRKNMRQIPRMYVNYLKNRCFQSLNSML